MTICLGETESIFCKCGRFFASCAFCQIVVCSCNISTTISKRVANTFPSKNSFNFFWSPFSLDSSLFWLYFCLMYPNFFYNENSDLFRKRLFAWRDPTRAAFSYLNLDSIPIWQTRSLDIFMTLLTLIWRIVWHHFVNLSDVVSGYSFWTSRTFIVNLVRPHLN